MKSEDFSTLNRLLDVVLRFCQIVKGRIDLEFSLDLRARAEILCIKEAQLSLVDDKHFLFMK